MTLKDCLDRTTKFIEVDDIMTSTDDKYQKKGSPTKFENKNNNGNNSINGGSTFHWPDYNKRDDQRSDKPQRLSSFTQLWILLSEILANIQDAKLNLLTDPRPLQKDPEQRDNSKFCQFHQDHGHYTSDCYNMKQQIEGLIRQGYSKKYVGKRNRDDNSNLSSSRKEQKKENSKTPTKREDRLHVINTVHGGPSEGQPGHKSKELVCKARHEVCSI